MLNNIIKFIVTGGYFGLSPIVPGTVGTIPGLLIFILISTQLYLYWIVTLLIIVIGIWFSSIAEKEIFHTKDSREIVIDEIAGFLITMSFFTIYDGWEYILTGFFLFRVFDILKPPPINRLQDLKGGWGVMADDLLAGLYSNVILQIVRYLLTN